MLKFEYSECRSFCIIGSLADEAGVGEKDDATSLEVLYRNVLLSKRESISVRIKGDRVSQFDRLGPSPKSPDQALSQPSTAHSVTESSGAFSSA